MITLKNIMYKFAKSGLWGQPFLMYVAIQFVHSGRGKTPSDVSEWMLCLALSLLPYVYTWMVQNSSPDEKTALTGREAAMRPPVDIRLESRKPQRLNLGKYKNRYVSMPLDEGLHLLVIGGTGSGKSSTLAINFLLLNPDVSFFTIDIKGELSSKATKSGNPHNLVFDPGDRTQQGYDPLYRLDEESTPQEILETMQSITFSLISMPASLKDPFWKNSARNLLLGLLIYFYRQGNHDFISIIDRILAKPMVDIIKQVIDTAQPNSNEYKYIVGFSGMAEETLGGIEGELKNHILIFATDQDIRYSFKENALKICPARLNEGYSIFIRIKEEKLSTYYDVLQLIVNQTLSEMERRQEDSEPVVFLLDELPRLCSEGKLHKLLDSTHTLRSRRVTLVLITQSTTALMSAYTENEVSDIMSNMPYKIILSASDRKTQQDIINWCGKYRQRRQSWNASGNGHKTSVAYEEKNIVEPSDLMTLQNTGEAILISPYGYNRIRKVPYYADPYIKPLADEVKNYNQSLKEAGHETIS